MFDKEAIQALQSGASIWQASQAMNDAYSGSEIIGLPEDFKVHDLEKFMQNRRRPRGTMSTSSIQSFTDYTLGHAEDGATVFIKPDSMTATAVLNLGTPGSPGHTDNRAGLELEATAAYCALSTIATGTGQSQQRIAEFLEDWVDAIKCFNSDGAIAPKNAVAAVRKITIEALRKVESEEQSLSASKSAFEAVSATSKEPIPTLVYFTCVPYTGLAERTFVMRLGVLTGGDKPSINLRIIKHEEHVQEMADELRGHLEAAFSGEAVACCIGSYAAAA